MSRTDKTRPVWVQFRDPTNRRLLIEDHDHEDGICSFDDWLENHERTWWRPGCQLYESYYGSNVLKVWPRQPCRGARYNRHRVIRARWIQARQQILAGRDPDGMTLVPSSHEYDSWLWEKWRS